ncbi:hypothetical protein ABZ370_15990 [Streptomyces sp. NPDC005962]|uniref:hypothetical protein n=1 Tax=Streptomyces sp. NPDC005962 TaxID=3154466 RepID=UPI0033CD82BA
MIHPPPTSVFASVRQHFDDPRVNEATLVTVGTDGNEAGPIQLTAAEAHEALYGPGADPQFSAAIWEAVLSAARADLTSHGSGRLLVIWLALPRLTGTAHRVCRRLRADRSDVEAEMTLALLEELTAPDTTTPLSIAPLVKAARTRAWHFARAGLREVPSTQVEHITQDRALTSAGETADTSAARQGLDVQVDRPDGPDGLRAPLRFRVHREHLREGTFANVEEGTRVRTTNHRTRQRRSRHRVGTLPIRPGTRQR